MTALPKPYILGITPYVGGESKARQGALRVIKLSSNENPFGASPKALTALSRDLYLEKYPDGDCEALRAAIGGRFGFEREQVICGAGSDEIISLVCRAYLSPGDEVVYATHSFLMYGITARVFGAVPIEIPERNLTPDLGALLAAVTPRTKIVFLTNPNNPTGSFNLPAEIQSFREKLPSHVLLVLDDAYAEYAQANPAYGNGFSLARTRDDVLTMRTFSKIYGLAGLRIGYGCGSKTIIDILNRVRSPFNVSTPAQVGALAALGDDDFLNRSVSHNEEWRVWTEGTLRSLGLTVWPSVTNFLLFSLQSPEIAESCRQFLKDKGILVRQMGAYKLPSCLRMSIGTGEEMTLACEAIAEYLESR